MISETLVNVYHSLRLKIRVDGNCCQNPKTPSPLHVTAETL